MDEGQEEVEGAAAAAAERGRRVRPTAGTILKITIRHINLTYYRLTRKSTLV